MTSLQVEPHAKEHVLAQLCHINWLIALVDDVRVALFSSSIAHCIWAHACIQLLSSLERSCILQLNNLFAEKVLQELVLVADFEELGCTPLIVVAEEFKLRYSLFAGLACPVCDFFVWTVRAVAVRVLATVEDLGWAAEAVQQMRLLLGRSVEQWQWLGQERPSIV